MTTKKKDIAYLWNDVVQLAAQKRSSVAKPTSKYLGEKYHDKKRARYYLKHNDTSLYFTHREVQTMHLLLEGMTVPQAAREMLLSSRTVEFYVKNVRLKLKCPSKIELVRLLVTEKYLDKLQVV